MSNDKNVANEQSDKTNEDLIYRLEEMSDEMLKSINNISSVRSQERLLLNLVKNANVKELEQFVTETEKQLVGLSAQLNELTIRTADVKSAVALARSNKQAAEAINALLRGLAVFKR